MKSLIRRSCIGIGIALTLTAIVPAQAQQPKVRSATFYRVKPDRVGDFMAATKEYAAEMKKLGSERHFTLWTGLTGPREYVLVRNYQSFGQLDEGPEPKLKDSAAQVTAIVNRIMDCVESYNRVLTTLDADLSLPLTTGELQPMARVLRTWVKPDQVGAFRELLKAELLPAAQKSGLKLFSIGHVTSGGSNFEYSTVVGLNKWADLDGESPIVRGFGGQAAYQKFLTKYRSLVTRTEYEMYRYLKDQSYVPPAQ